jgi:hypothetical protein
MKRETFKMFLYTSKTLFFSTLYDKADVKPIIHFHPYRCSRPRAALLATKVA